MKGRSAQEADAAPDAAIPPERRVGALAEAFRRALRSSLIIANVGAGIVAFGALVIGSQRGTKVPLVALLPIDAVVFGLVACALLPVLVRGPLRDALETFAWAGRSASIRWRDVAGRRPPGTPAASRAWLDAAPALDPTWAPLRAEAALFAGDLAEAARAIEACPAATPGERFGREAMRSEAAWMGGGRLDLGAARRALAEIRDADEMMWGRAQLATIGARSRLAERGAWREPLEELRPALGERADRILRAELWPAVFRLEAIVAIAVGVVLVVVVGLG
jgi:hypothetical protein